MKPLFVIAMGWSLVFGATAQQQIPPPVISAPPPRNPNVVPARPQPGVATGATGRSAIPQPPATIARPPDGEGTFTPFPVAVPPNTHPVYPEVFDPLELVELYQILETLPEPSSGAGTAQGRPGGGLGVTITGGSTNQPGVISAPPAVQPPPATNVPAVTNINVPANSSGRVQTNSRPNSGNTPYP